IELTLRVQHCRALEVTPAGRMIVRAALGANETFLHCRRDEDDDESVGMNALLGDGPLTFANLEDETRFQATHLRNYHGVRSGAGVVIRTQHGPFGVLLAYSGEERTFADYELAFLRATADIVGQAITRARTEQALRTSEARLRQLIASTLDAVITVDRAMHVIEWNREAEAIFGIAARHAVGMPLRESLFRQNDLETFRYVMNRHRHGRPSRMIRQRYETVVRRADGREFPAEVTIAPAGSGSDLTFTAFIRDISDRKSAQHALEQREKRFRTIVEKSWSGVVLLDADLRF